MKKKILVVDDEEDICDFVKRALEREGNLDVITTINPEDTEQICVEEKPDLILLDIVMPVMDGTEVIKILKKNPQTKNIKIIVASGGGEMIYNKKVDKWSWEPMTPGADHKPDDYVDDPSAQHTAELYGVTRFLRKPFPPSVLRQVVKEVLAEAEKEKKEKE